MQPAFREATIGEYIGEYKESNMKKAVTMTVCCALVLCCCYTHRRVIKAAIKGEPMPKAPKWHVWVPKENRK